MLQPCCLSCRFSPYNLPSTPGRCQPGLMLRRVPSNCIGLVTNRRMMMIIVNVTAVSKLARGRLPVAQRSNKVKDVTEMHASFNLLSQGVWCFYLIYFGGICACHMTAGEHGAQLRPSRLQGQLFQPWINVLALVGLIIQCSTKVCVRCNDKTSLRAMAAPNRTLSSARLRH